MNKKISGKRAEMLREMLLKRKREMWQELKEELFRQAEPAYRQQIETMLDEGDRAIADLVGDTVYQVMEVKKANIDKIDEALRKLELDGTYGICDDCGKEIDSKRLHNMPFAIYCIECGNKREAVPHPSL
jgi:DnaK suppressor protein